MAEALRMKTEDIEKFLEELVIGITPHSDVASLTILLQLNDVDGLEIRKDGKWVPVKPLPNAFIVNIGDISEIITNGTYSSIEHRATLHSERERLSLATLCGPRRQRIHHNQNSELGTRKPEETWNQKHPTREVLCLYQVFKSFAKQPITTIPNRYLRPEIERDVVSDGSQILEIPVIDMQRLVSEEPTNSELNKLDSACKEWGFFQLVNHGVSTSLLEKVKTQIQDFFHLPMEEKKQFWQYPGQVEGFGQAFVLSENQKLDWGDMFYMMTLPLHLRKPHLFPNLPLPLRDTMELYTSELNNLSMAILANMAQVLHIKTDDMKEFFEDGRQGIRMNYYPPCHLPEQVIGLTPHSDASPLTILLQLNDVDGLQIRKDGKWVPVKPLPNAFVVNIGDVLEIITNGTYRSIEHRVTVNSKKERLSVATFRGPRWDGEIGPAPSLISKQMPAMFRRVKVEEYFKGLFARKLQGKSYLDFMRIEHD